jgi:hypothetical protein
MNMEPRKQAPATPGDAARKAAIIAALRTFMNQRPGLEFGNYGDVRAYRSEMRGITRDLHDARELMRAVELSDSITADDLIRAASSAFSGRLTIHVDADAPFGARVAYCTGQYWPTEYRRAVCAVLASALWAHVREHCMPKGRLVHNSETGETFERYGSKDLRAGDWLRAHFRQQFGRGIASRWFS